MFKRAFELTGEYILLMQRVFRKPEKWSLFGKQLILEADKLVMQSIPLIALISIFIQRDIDICLFCWVLTVYRV